MDVVFAEHNPARILALVLPGNDASVRIADKLGMSPAGTATHYEREMLVFEARREP